MTDIRDERTKTAPGGGPPAVAASSVAAGLVACYPETRIGPFDFYAATCTEPLRYGSADAQRACGDSWRGVTKDLCLFSQEDPAAAMFLYRDLYLYAGDDPVSLCDPLGLWVVHDFEDPTLNTIVCDGKGGVRVQLSTRLTRRERRCLGDCITLHENSHRLDALAANPTVCAGKRDGLVVEASYSVPGERRNSEIAAHNLSISCEMIKIVRDPADQNCCNATLQKQVDWEKQLLATYRAWR